MKTRKELIDEYKQIKFRMGVFQIRNTANGKIFVERSENLDKVWNRHLAQLRFGGHPNPALQKEWNVFGEDKFVFEVLSEIEQQEGDTTDPKKELQLLEKMFIEELQPFEDKGYHNRPKTR